MRIIRITFIYVLVTGILIAAIHYLKLLPEFPQKPQAMFLSKKYREDENKRIEKSGYEKWDIFLINPEELGKKDKYGHDVIYISLDGRSNPKGKSGNKPAMLITSISDDKDYGQSKKPIKIGGAEKKEGSANEQRYLNSLYGPNGATIEYERIGSCCPFKTSNEPNGIGFLDMFKITYKGLEKPIILYLNMYDYEEPKVPYGFSIKSH